MKRRAIWNWLGDTGRLALAAVLLVWAPPVEEAGAEGLPRYNRSPDIRVGLQVDVTEAELSCFGGGFELRGSRGDPVSFGTGETIRVQAAQNGLEVWSVRGRRVGQFGRSIAVRSSSDRGYLMVNGYTYRGEIDIRSEDGKALTVINTLPLEAYLRGVVGREIGFLGDRESSAIEVQAIVSRTYALGQMEKHAERSYHVYADVRDQVYGGRKAESSWVDEAVRKTSGRVLTDDRGLARTYYHSTCGGHTSNIERIWPEKESRSYLSGIRDAIGGGRSYCSWSKYFRWSEAWSARELGEIVRRSLPEEVGLPPGTDVGYLRDLEILEKSDSGRVLSLRITTTSGGYTVSGDRIRWVLRPAKRPREILRSVMFKLDKRYDSSGVLVSIVARGGGWGHGVGLCQVGAISLSRLGVDSNRILGFYFPGTYLQKIY